jgi:hypothetical protein
MPAPAKSRRCKAKACCEDCRSYDTVDILGGDRLLLRLGHALGRSRHSPPVETVELKVLNRAFFVYWYDTVLY